MRSVLFAALMGATTVLAVKCSLDSKCPEDAPCCSQYGECGLGAFCLGGCDPRMSFKLEACAPAPVCVSRTTKFDSMDSIVQIRDYLGDDTKAEWVAQGEPAQYGDSVLLTMPKGSVGTVLASTSYLWYGSVSARLKTSRGKGVVTAFILLSDVKDEIDYEFVGVDLETAQTNFYFQGIPNYHNSGNISDLSDTFNNFHDYKVNWTPDKIEWSVDGKIGRTVERKDTWNSTTNQWEYPQTPARVQLSIWPGGLSTNAQGTIDWAGGEIDWDAEDVKDKGYFYTAFSEVTIGCYTGDDKIGTNSGKSYTYDDARGTNDTVVDGDKSTILGSSIASGLNPNAGKSTKDPNKDKGKNIPGGDNGAQGQDHSDAGSSNKAGTPSDSGSNSGSDSGSTSGSSSDGATPENCNAKSFNQKCGDNADSSSGNTGGGQSGSSKTSASALAMVVAGCALYWL